VLKVLVTGTIPRSLGHDAVPSWRIHSQAKRR
jgi:hypothetical protein